MEVSKIRKIVKTNLYWDFNKIDFEEKSFSVDSKNKNTNFSGDFGFKFRVFDGVSFLEVSSSEFDSNFEKEIKKLVKSAQKNFEKNTNKIELKIDKSKLKKNFGNKFFDFDDKKINLHLEDLKERLMKNDKVVNVRAIFKRNLEEHTFVNKYKNLTQKISIIIFGVICYFKDEKGEIKDHLCIKNLEKEDEMIEKKNQILKDTTKAILEKQNLKNLNGGKYDVILSPYLSGLLAHESFGHGLEADTIIKKRAKGYDYLDKKIGSNKINIVDYGAKKGIFHGSIFFDSEGNLCDKTYLVENGKIANFMSDALSKSVLNLKKSFSSRFESYDHKNYVRMTNTYFEPQKSSFNKMLKNIENGIYIKTASGGMEDPKNFGVQIQGCFGQKIKNGKLVGEFYEGFSITGHLFDIMKNIEDIGSDFSLEDCGFCGKGHKEWIRVSSGGPHLKINKMILG